MASLWWGGKTLRSKWLPASKKNKNSAIQMRRREKTGCRLKVSIKLVVLQNNNKNTFFTAKTWLDVKWYRRQIALQVPITGSQSRIKHIMCHIHWLTYHYALDKCLLSAYTNCMLTRLWRKKGRVVSSLALQCKWLQCNNMSGLQINSIQLFS